MKQIDPREMQTSPMPKKGMSDFSKALMWTAIGTVVLPWLCVIAAIVAAIVFAVQGKRKIMSGILVGLGIGIVALGASCFAIIAGLNGF